MKNNNQKANTVNNALFVGSTAELAKLLKNGVKEVINKKRERNPKVPNTHNMSEDNIENLPSIEDYKDNSEELPSVDEFISEEKELPQTRIY